MRNEEQISASYYAGKLDERLFQAIQKLVNEIENGDFDKKKILSEKEMSIALPYDYKNLFEDNHETLYFGTSYDRESFNYYDFKSIEWVKVKPHFEEHTYQGRLSYEYDSINEVYVIYGYK